MLHALKVAINRRIVNKIDKGDKSQFFILTHDFENLEITLTELADFINQGHPFCAQHKDTRKSDNFICSDVLAVDIDCGMQLSEAIENEFVRQYAGLIYTTPSHTAEQNRFRIVFALERTITDSKEMTAAYRGIIRKFAGDEACKDACRPFYGSKGSQPIMFGNALPNDQLAELIEIGQDVPSISDRNKPGSKTNYPPVSRRSSKQISRDQSVTLADGMTRPFEDVPFGENIYCPIHEDRNPSAFVVKSEKNNKGVYCHSCSATFWMKSLSEGPADDYDFYRIDEIIRKNEYDEDPGNSYDDDAPDGLIAMANEERSCHSMAQQFISAIPDHEGVTFLKSKKGSGKSQLLADKVAVFRAQGKSVLLVGHRQTLIRAMADRLGLTCYIYSEGVKIKNNKPSAYYAICVDSMSKLLKPKYDKYDVVIIDESEQVFSHLIGDTLKDKRRASYMQLFHYLAVAKSVIVADADLGPITIEGVYQAMCSNFGKPMRRDVGYHFYLNDHRDSQRDFHHYGSDSHLMQDMLSAIGGGGRHYIATNSMTKAVELQEAIRLKIGADTKIMLVTSKTTGLAPVQKFIANIKTEILKYDVVIASPTLGTGIDITFAGEAQHIDTVFGFFVGRVNTHFDIDQQIARVRHPKAIKVWVSPEKYQFETEPEVILCEAKMSSALNDSLIGYNDDGSTRLDETYLNVYAHVKGIARASKNNLMKNLMDLRKREGWNVVYVDIDKRAADFGREVQQIAKSAVNGARIVDISTAERLGCEDYDILDQSLSPVDKAEDDAMRRFEIEKFYREDVSSELVAQDDHGRYRRKLSLLEVYLSSADKLIKKDFYESELTTILTDSKKRTLKQLVLRALLIPAGLSSTHQPIKCDAIITSSGLGQFVASCRENSARLQDLFGIALRADLELKPMSQLGEILKLMGLSLEKVSSKKIFGTGKKINFYGLNKDEWETARHYLALRNPEVEQIVELLAA